MEQGGRTGVSMSVTQELYKLLDDLKPGRISGWRLYSMMYERTGKHTYPKNLLDMARRYADITGADFICIDADKSIYDYRPGFIKIGNMKKIDKE